MPERRTPMRELLERLCDPMGFLVQSWVVSVAIGIVVVVILIAVLSMMG